MARIRKLEVRNFRSVRSLDWVPSAGVNCLIGPGDSGKSTVLDAIDLCLGARRSVPLSDSDFYALDVSKPVSITVTIGQLSDSLKSLESYADFLRGFDLSSGVVEDEPRKGLETVLTLKLLVEADLEPVWSLYSERAEAAGTSRSLAWKDRVGLAPARLGHHPNSNLSWARGSVLNRLSDERADVSAELAKAARDARSSFGDQAGTQLAQTLATVTKTANSLGVPVGAGARALLDAHSTSFGDGAISLHDGIGVPLRSLGTGSARLLIAGLHREAADAASVVLVDEIEHGLEPHRLTRLLGSLGAKEAMPPLQVFLTTHSPVALRELRGDQLLVVRSVGGIHSVIPVGVADDVQSTIRRDPEAFLASKVFVCEGASEVGFIRGLDDYWVSIGQKSMQAAGVALVDTGGGDADRCFYRGGALQRLGYQTVAVLDNDKTPTPAVVASYQALGGNVFAWRERRALEDELFLSLPNPAILQLVSRALELTEDGLVDAHIRTTSGGAQNLSSVLAQVTAAGLTVETRALLGRASRIRKAGWFKSLTKMEAVTRDIVGPALQECEQGFVAAVTQIYQWTR